MNTNPINLKEMGRRVKNLRLSQHKTQEAFAESVHISTSYLALIEAGKRTASLDVVAQIAKTCKINVDYLLFGEMEDSSSANKRKFLELCKEYSDLELSRALRLMEFYLMMDK